MRVEENRVKGVAVAVLLLLASLSLAGCGADDAAQTTHVSGQLSYPEDVPLPNKGTVEVSLVELTDGDVQGPHVLATDTNPLASKRIVAKQTMHDLHSLPIAFDMKVNSTLLQKEGRYAVTAQITSEDGRPRWRTALPFAIDPKKVTEGINLVLSPTPWNDTVLTFMRMSCVDGFAFAVATFKGRAALRIGERGFELRAVHAVSGARYAANGVWLLQKTGGESTINVDDQQHAGCRPVSDRMLSTDAPTTEPAAAPE